ncbi:hypothetical protein MRX96_038171 [Rhipicephalus microplus]
MSTRILLGSEGDVRLKPVTAPPLFFHLPWWSQRYEVSSFALRAADRVVVSGLQAEGHAFQARPRDCEKIGCFLVPGDRVSTFCFFRLFSKFSFSTHAESWRPETTDKRRQDASRHLPVLFCQD